MQSVSGLKQSWLMLACIGLVTACAGSGISTTHYFLIDPINYAEPPAREGDAIILEIIDVHIPQYLERFHIASRTEENRLIFSETNQWGENLRKNLLRTISANLSRLLSTNDVSTPLNRSMSLPDFRVQVDLERFERDNDGRVKLFARWQLSDNSEPVSITVYRIELESPEWIDVQDYDRIVSAMQSLYGLLCVEIAETILVSGNEGGN